MFSVIWDDEDSGADVDVAVYSIQDAEQFQRTYLFKAFSNHKYDVYKGKSDWAFGIKRNHLWTPEPEYGK